MLTVDTTKSGEVFKGVSSGTLNLPEDKKLKMHIFIDRSSIEVFGGDGQISITNRIFPGAGSTGIRIFSNIGQVKVVQLDVWELKNQSG